jgi:hypothetical protein
MLILVKFYLNWSAHEARSLHFKLEVFIWRHVLYVPKSFNTISRNYCHFLAEGIWKVHTVYFVIYLYVFKLVCTRWENFITAFVTVKSTIDTSHSQIPVSINSHPENIYMNISVRRIKIILQSIWGWFD